MSRNDPTERSLIQIYADSEHDAAVLNMMLKSYTEDPSTIGLGVDRVLARSISRAELESQIVREKYEGQ